MTQLGQQQRQIAIRRLPPEVVARIAAGEMISRPSAMVKELIENALDAEATRINIEVLEALDRSLRVGDDGCGIARDELPLAFERYATSKIAGEEDLLRVATLGFRGEALASIAEIARVILVSRARHAEEAWEIRAEAGRIGDVQAAARAPGTTVTVEDLFFNTPVRKRFLKKGPGELRQARTTVTAYALATPGVGWTLDVDGKRVLDLPPAADLRGRVVEIHGSRLSGGLVPIDWQEGDLSLHGLIGVPELARGGTQHQFMFVNGRWVSAPWVGQAVRNGYGDLLPSQHNPWFVLFLVLPPDQVDVNLHPTKREVRFYEERGVFGSVQQAVHQAVAHLVPRIFLGREQEGTAREATPAGATQGGETAGWFPGRSWGGAGGGLASGPVRAHAEPLDGLEQAARLYGGNAPTAIGPAEDGLPGLDSLDRPAASSLVSLWQLHGRYVLAQTRKGLLVIDQHAAHERILYEQVRDRLARGEASAQQTLFPVVVELDDQEMILFQEIRGMLARMGFAFDELDDRSVLVRGVPPLWRARGEGAILHDLLDEALGMGLREGGGLREGETVEGLARSYACRAAIKAGEPLSVEEMNHLIDALFGTQRPHGDPHGRPTFVFLSLADLDRRFGRGGEM
jgi:DNA mismatch repair protein MutL